MDNRKILISTAVVIVAVAGVLYIAAGIESIPEPMQPKVIIYKLPTCGCCVGYAAESRKQGYEVEMVATEDMSAVKEKYNIPREMESCHTTVVDGYFIEGHVPFEIVSKLLLERPDVDGIALPNMPAGTPGMSGTKQDQYTIYKLVDGEYSEYVTI
jgi:hypothetical protein